MALRKEYLTINSERKNNGAEPLALVRGAGQEFVGEEPWGSGCHLFLLEKYFEVACDREQGVNHTKRAPSHPSQAAHGGRMEV